MSEARLETTSVSWAGLLLMVFIVAWRLFSTAEIKAAIEPPTPKKRMEPPRDGHGRYRIVLDGRERSFTRATTVASTLDDTFALTKWKQRKAMFGFMKRPDLFALAHHLTEDQKAECDNLVDQAMEAAGSTMSANLGTAMHGVLEWHDAGEPCQVPEFLGEDFVAYKNMLKKSGIEMSPEHIERIVVLHDLMVAGTFDRLVSLFGELYVFDLKTGQSLDWSWPAIAVQLSLYSRADTIYDPATRTHSPMPKVNQDWGLICHLPVGCGECTLHWVDLNAGWEAVSHSMWARRWRRRKNLTLPFTGQPPRGPGI